MKYDVGGGGSFTLMYMDTEIDRQGKVKIKPISFA